MFVGAARIVLGLSGNDSLKGKRGVVKSVIRRTRNRFNVAMSEVDDNDVHARAVLGFAVVGNDKRVLNSVIDKIVDFIDELGLAPVEDVRFSIEDYG
ncbi:MAG: hypothetical protein ACI9WU_003189 [Myxococcota bacterium]|jgi:uncharacterized protein YlxP (DUF503 family)